MYRNPKDKADSVELKSFIKNFENLYEKVKNHKLYAMFFTSDFNAHPQTWYSEEDKSPEAVALNNLFSYLIVTQMIFEPKHFMQDTARLGLARRATGQCPERLFKNKDNASSKPIFAPR